MFALLRGHDGHAPQRRFVVVGHDDGEESIVLGDVAGSGPELDGRDRIDG